jgi:hypothetical protein
LTVGITPSREGELKRCWKRATLRASMNWHVVHLVREGRHLVDGWQYTGQRGAAEEVLEMGHDAGQQAVAALHRLLSCRDGLRSFQAASLGRHQLPHFRHHVRHPLHPHHPACSPLPPSLRDSGNQTGLISGPCCYPLQFLQLYRSVGKDWLKAVDGFS